MEFTFRPIQSWPVPMTENRQRSRFSARWDDTRQLLISEIDKLRRPDAAVVIQAAVGESDIRRDGMMYAHARPSHPGVIVSFESVYGPLSYPCDTFTLWQDNVRAIALALQALRTVDHYGVTRLGEQYTGWKALPSSGGFDMRTDDAIRLLIEESGWYTGSPGSVLESPSTLDSIYRRAAKATHPDSSGLKDDTRFKQVQIAYEICKKQQGSMAA